MSVALTNPKSCVALGLKLSNALLPGDVDLNKTLDAEVATVQEIDVFTVFVCVETN
jgi:hypothetical protein